MKGVVLTLGLFLGMSVQAQEQAYETTIVKISNVDSFIQLHGTVDAVNKGTLSAQTSGRIVSVNADVNDIVRQGDVLLEISAKQQSASLDAALARLNSANAQSVRSQAQVKRYRELYPVGAISKERLDSAEAEARSAIAEVKGAKASVIQAKDSLGYTSIEAPYTGVVTKRFVELGETVSPGTRLMEGFSLSPLRVVTEIPQRFHDKVNSAEQFSISTDRGQFLTATEAKLFNYANVNSRSFKVRLELLNEDTQLYPGSWVNVQFVHGQHQSIMVPTSAVIRRGELSVVYRLIDQTLQMNPIRVGETHGAQIEVLSGLEPGDEILTNALTYTAAK
ncbi:efflux RND transporter periplasmic adaptor subunit [Vibrio sp. ZSDZ34]|jgi:RND family efflux transporter MFP subunit|uniref:Efflux RND transporter periplasmic adaptor subunit n=1 Tax=Vibrio gelatinilyticus TaxID=2893468 RepID=A0A9X1WBT3_9VIBR|nr:efflux RND transporter periplasmic adaptor subunit [Vibrio gelatinilyticus]MCJ2377181.1 efflux RND transporter periplasmic adaptor subunit [Vibrio gelatinilyticus]